MNFRQPIDSLRRWRSASLANTFALHAALIAIASMVLVALMSLTVIYWVESNTLRERLQEKSGRVNERLEASIAVVESSTAALARNPMFMSALLDSRGRDSYVAPFLENFNFPIAAASGLALCDINGQRLAGTRSALSSCRANSALFAEVLRNGFTQRELVPLPDGHLGWTVYQGVVFGYTGTVEGVVVTQLDLHDVLHVVPSDLDLVNVALVRADNHELLIIEQKTEHATPTLTEARVGLFAGKPQAVPFAMEIVVRDQLLPFENKLRPLGLSYGLAGLLMLLAVIFWTRKVSRVLIAPLTKLTGIAHQLAETRDLSIAVPQSRAGEVAQLAKAFEIMVHAVKLSEASLEDKVSRRTAELEQSRKIARDRTEQLDAIFDLSPDGFVSFDALQRVSFANRAFLRLTALQADEVIGLPEPDFSRLLARKCLPGACFAGVAGLLERPQRPAETPVDASESQIQQQVIELAGPGQRVLEVSLRQSQAENVSQILYLRDVTHQTEVDRMKNEFLTTAAHELRTPMASIYGYCELLLNMDFDEAQRHEMLSTIFQQSELMASIINELLDLARIEARRGKDFVVELLTLQDIVRDTVASYKPPLGRQPPLVQASSELLWVRADRKKMRQAVLNVLSNAYKYSPQGGEVQLTFTHAPSHGLAQVGVTVSDHGIGLTPEQLQRVCERFYRADNTGNIPGTGLGMSIVKEIVEIHGGQVQIESQAGVGTQVTLWLPDA